MKSTKFIFDVDGTLTPSRQKINREFAIWFSKFAERNEVYLVTGSDRPKTIEQIGEVIYHRCKLVYQCSGAECWQGDRKVYTSDWILDNSAHTWLEEQLHKSEFDIRTGSHIEHRPGCVNFSIVGRNANPEQREQYIKHDTATSERKRIAAEFNSLFVDLQATVGGETGLDIGPLGSDKSQILKNFDNKSTLLFFGDAMFEGGNDYPLGDAITSSGVGTSYAVSGWEETWNILQNK
jgi:phosphomannomutase